MTTLHIATAANSAYLPGLEVLVCSTLLHTKPDVEIHFHVFDDGISDDNWEKLGRLAARFHNHVRLHRIEFSDKRLAGFPMLNGSRTTYARLLLGDSLPEIDKVLYLDSDLLVGRDPQEIFDMDLRGRTALAADDSFLKNLSEDCAWLPEEATRGYRYFNAGVLLLDLQRWRKLNYLEQCLSALSNSPEKCRFWDQTVLNYILRDDVGNLPACYNCFAYFIQDAPSGPVNFHVGNAKPWMTDMHRLDHYLWRAFYRDLIDPHRKWNTGATTGQKVFHDLSLNGLTQWIFRGIMLILITRSNHGHQRLARQNALKTAVGSPAIVSRARKKWRGLRTYIRPLAVAQ